MTSYDKQKQRLDNYAYKETQNKDPHIAKINIITL